MKQAEVRRVYFAFDYDKDASRRKDFLAQAKDNCDFRIEDLSLPKAIHDFSWQREALARIHTADVVIVLLGPDTHTAPGVRDEISLAGQADRPVIQIRPRGRHYASIGKDTSICIYSWKQINRVLRQPSAFARNPGKRYGV